MSLHGAAILAAPDMRAIYRQSAKIRRKTEKIDLHIIGISWRTQFLRTTYASITKMIKSFSAEWFIAPHRAN